MYKWPSENDVEKKKLKKKKEKKGSQSAFTYSPGGYTGNNIFLRLA